MRIVQRYTAHTAEHYESPVHIYTSSYLFFSVQAVAMGGPKVASNQATEGPSGLPARVFSYTPRGSSHL